MDSYSRLNDFFVGWSHVFGYVVALEHIKFLNDARSAFHH